MDIGPGSIVYSKAGRDKGGYFIVMSQSGEYISICDGKGRKTDKPKRKKLNMLKSVSVFRVCKQKSLRQVKR